MTGDTMVKHLKNKPRWLERIYSATHWMLRPMRSWLKAGGWVEGAFVRTEQLSKKTLFDCQMCGQCVSLRRRARGWLLRDRTLHAVCLGERVGTLQGDTRERLPESA